MIAPLRVLLYAPHFAEYALRLAEGLAAAAEVLLLCERRNLDAECPSSLVARATARLRLETFDGSASLPHGFWTRHVRLPSIVRAFRPTIAHVQEQADQPTAAMLAHLSRRMPVVLTVHDPRPHSGSDAAKADAARHYHQRLRAGAAAYHVHGAHCERELRAVWEVDRPLISTPIGVHLVPTADALQPREPGTLLFFGRMEAYKGLETLLDAADLLRVRGAACRLIVAGQGPEQARLASRLAAPHIERHDRFVGHDEAIRFFQRASIVVVPYRDATQSAVVSAAFGNARPVVASRVGGLPDAIDHGRDGLLVTPDDPQALAGALASLLADDRKIELLQDGARERARRELDWRDIAQNLETFYRRLLEPESRVSVHDGGRSDKQARSLAPR